MTPPQSEICPLLFFARVPKGITSADLCKDLVSRFSKHELASVQDFGAGRFEVGFQTKAAVERFLIDPVVCVRVQDMV